MVYLIIRDKMNNITTVKLYNDTKMGLDLFREYKNESYDEIIKKMLYVVKNVKSNPKLSKETVDSIENARKRIASGNFITEEDAKKRLGL